MSKCPSIVAVQILLTEPVGLTGGQGAANAAVVSPVNFPRVEQVRVVVANVMGAVRVVQTVLWIYVVVHINPSNFYPVEARTVVVLVEERVKMPANCVRVIDSHCGGLRSMVSLCEGISGV